MKWKDALKEIESAEFDVRLNVVSSYRLFLKAARQEPAVVALYQAMQESEEVSGKVLGRICEFSTGDIDPQYANPRDTVLTVLLWLMSLTNRTYAEVAAQYVSGSRNCWYALKMAKAVLTSTRVATDSRGLNPEWETAGTVSTAKADTFFFLNPFAIDMAGIHTQKAAVLENNNVSAEMWTLGC